MGTYWGINFLLKTCTEWMTCYHINKLLLSQLPYAFPSVTAFKVGSCYTSRLVVLNWRKSVELLTGINKTKLHWCCFLYNLSLIVPSCLLTCWCQYRRIPFLLIFIVAYQLFSLDSKGSDFRLSLGRLYDPWNHISIFGELFCPPPSHQFPSTHQSQGEKYMNTW
jgi:hypothetical protein